MPNESFVTGNIQGNTLEELRREVQFKFQQVMTHLDELAGKRGQATFYSHVDMNQQRVTNIGIPAHTTDAQRVDQCLGLTAHGTFDAGNRPIDNVGQAFNEHQAVTLEQLRQEVADIAAKAVTLAGDVTITGTLAHQGTLLAFYNASTIAQASASANLTDNSGGTANDTVQALTDPADTPATADILRDDLVANLLPELRNNFADLTAKVNKALTVLRDVGLMGT